MHSIVVTGGLGQIGSFVVDYLIEKKIVKNIIIIDNFSSPKVSFSSKNVIIYNTDIRDYNNLKTIFNKKIDGIIHCAAQISVPNSILDPLNDAMQNIIGTLNMLNIAISHNITRLITIGSAGALGEQVKFPIPSNACKIPLSPYGISKSAAESYTTIIGSLNDMNFNVVRPFNVYSERMKDNDPYSGVINKFYNSIKYNRSIIIEGNGFQRRDFIHAKDVAEISIKALLSDKKSEIINAATGNPISILELANKMKEIFQTNNEILFVKKRLGDINHSYGVKSSIKPTNGFITIDEGIDIIKQKLLNSHRSVNTR